MKFHTLGSSLVLAIALIASGCATEPGAATTRVWPEYGPDGRLQLLKYDSQGSGTIDVWSYMDGARVLRIEIDKDHDGRADRWEYYGLDQRLEKIGVSSTNDGQPDSWSFRGPDAAVTRIEIATRRDGKVSRVEYYERGAVVRAEEDTDADGSSDKWETYDGARLASVAFDTSHRGFPDRRLTYAASGATTLDVDPDGGQRLGPAAAAGAMVREPGAR